MKKTILLYFSFFIFTHVFSQHSSTPTITLKWAPTGLILGDISLQGEYSFGGSSSLTAKIGIPVNAHHTFQYDGNDARFDLKATTFLAGYRMYFSKKHLHGLYLEPFFNYVHHSGEGVGSSVLDGKPVVMNFNNNYNGVGVGAQLGAQFIIKKRFVIDLFFLGPEINSVSNNFKAVETTSTLSWNSIEAGEVEQDVRNFIDKFPFLKNRTKIMVDKDYRSATADFSGPLPGFRIGISFGVAF